MDTRVTGRRLMAVAAVLGAFAVVLFAWAGRTGAEPVQAAPAPRATSAAPTASVPTRAEPRPRFSPAPTATPTPSASQSPSAAAKPTTSKPKPPAQKATASGFRLRIPEIGLDRRMYGGGLSSDGTIDPEPGTVMWFMGYERVRPGRVGTAVVAGHVASGNRRDVFADLADVDVGDRVQIVDDGKAITYRVTRAGAINKYALTTDPAVWGPNTSRSRLAIITCDDAFGFRSDGHRKANFVVIAERA
jgi:sortase (surface protein transpeptidase)